MYTNESHNALMTANDAMKSCLLLCSEFQDGILDALNFRVKIDGEKKVEMLNLKMIQLDTSTVSLGSRLMTVYAISQSHGNQVNGLLG